MLTCRTCKVEKPDDAFYADVRRKSGFMAECKSCQRQRNQKWIDANRDRFRHLNKRATNLKRQRNPVKCMLASARARAKKCGLEFTITESDVVIPSRCPILGIALTFGLGWGKGQSNQQRDSRASLDRIDNTKGYVPGNVIVVSYRANRLKSDATVAELLKLARFYGQLASERPRAVRLPEVQSLAQKENREVSARLGDERRNAGAFLPSLRLEGDRR